MTRAENLADVEKHARDFAERRGFTYTVRGASQGEVIGCVYIYPPGPPDAHSSDSTAPDASVRSWVTAAHASLDRSLWQVVTDWLRTEWPFEQVAYAARS